jgi:glucose-6-phosphate isomerase
MQTQSTAWHDFSKASLHQVRRLKELEPVLYDRKCCRWPYLEMPVYEVYRDCCNDEARHLLLKHGLRYDLTVMPPLLLGEECVKTMGHHHLSSGDRGAYPEIFEVLEGEAKFLLQEECSGKVVRTVLLTVMEGERVVVSGDQGHVMINASSRRLVTGNLLSCNCVQTYDQYMRRQGAAFYVLNGGTLVRNTRYPQVPKVEMLDEETPSFLASPSGLIETLLKDPDRLSFLNDFRTRLPEHTGPE